MIMIGLMMINDERVYYLDELVSFEFDNYPIM